MKLYYHPASTTSRAVLLFAAEQGITFQPTECSAILKYEKARHWLQVLDRHIIGPGHDYVCGPRPSIADYQGAALVALGEVARLDYSSYPNVRRWLARMEALSAWKPVYAAIDGYAASLTCTVEPLERIEA